MKKEIQKEEYPKVTNEMMGINEVENHGYDALPIEVPIKEVKELGMKKTEDREIKETYPREEKKKLVVFYTVSKVLYQGDQYDYADAKIVYCCEGTKALVFVNNSIQDKTNFAKMMYQGRPIERCPFCGAEIEINK